MTDNHETIKHNWLATTHTNTLELLCENIKKERKISTFLETKQK